MALVPPYMNPMFLCTKTEEGMLVENGTAIIIDYDTTTDNAAAVVGYMRISERPLKFNPTSTKVA